MPERKPKTAPTRRPTTTPNRSTPRPVQVAEAREAGSMDIVRDLIQEVRDLRDDLGRLKIEIEKLWAKERLHGRAVLQATKTPRAARKPSGPRASAPRVTGGKAAAGGKVSGTTARVGARATSKPGAKKSGGAKKATKRSRAARPKSRG